MMSVAEQIEIGAATESTRWTTFADSPEFRALTTQLRIFTVAYLASGDALFATRTSHNCKPTALRQIAYKNLHRASVIAAVNKFRGRTEKDVFIGQVEDTVASSSGIAKIQALRLLAKLKFGLTDEAETPQPEPAQPKPPRRKSAPASQLSVEAPVKVFKIGDKVTQDGKLYRVTEVDAVGKILNAEEIDRAL
jgi:hypothetical protein